MQIYKGDRVAVHGSLNGGSSQDGEGGRIRNQQKVIFRKSKCNQSIVNQNKSEFIWKSDKVKDKNDEEIS